MAGFDWFRWHHGTVTDPKFALVAKKAGASLPDVLAVWAFLLEKASAATVRGVFGDIDTEAVDCLYGFADGRTGSILAALDARRLTKDGAFCAWTARQPKREREGDNSAERVAKHRAKKHTVTPSNAKSHHETPRGEESREEEASSVVKPPHTEGTIGSPAADSAPEDACGSFEGQSPSDQAAVTAKGMVYVEASKALIAAGCSDVCASDPFLRGALDDGITLDELLAVVRGKGAGKGIAYAAKAARGKRADAAASGGAVVAPQGSTRNTQGPSPRKSPEEEKAMEREALELMRRQHEELGYGAH